jgi:hypothetical protein
LIYGPETGFLALVQDMSQPTVKISVPFLSCCAFNLHNSGGQNKSKIKNQKSKILILTFDFPVSPVDWLRQRVASPEEKGWLTPQEFYLNELCKLSDFQLMMPCT